MQSRHGPWTLCFCRTRTYQEGQYVPSHILKQDDFLIHVITDKYTHILTGSPETYLSYQRKSCLWCFCRWVFLILNAKYVCLPQKTDPDQEAKVGEAWSTNTPLFCVSVWLCWAPWWKTSTDTGGEKLRRTSEAAQSFCALVQPWDRVYPVLRFRNMAFGLLQWWQGNGSGFFSYYCYW